MMPLVEYVGNATPEDNTEIITLNRGPDGSPRSIRRGRRGLLSGAELRALAANYQVTVIEGTDETDPEDIPTEMPDGYDADGYKEGEDPTKAVFTADAYPDDENPDLITPEGVEPQPTPAAAPAAVATSPAASPPVPGAPSPSGAAAPTTQESAGTSSSSEPTASPGASG